jgi:hypothetical protein
MKVGEILGQSFIRGEQRYRENPIVSAHYTIPTFENVGVQAFEGICYNPTAFTSTVSIFENNTQIDSLAIGGGQKVYFYCFRSANEDWNSNNSYFTVDSSLSSSGWVCVRPYYDLGDWLSLKALTSDFFIENIGGVDFNLKSEIIKILIDYKND